MKATNANLRDLLYGAANMAAVEAQDVFLAGMRPDEERRLRIVAQIEKARTMFDELVAAGKLREKTLKGFPGYSRIQKWDAEAAAAKGNG